MSEQARTESFSSALLLAQDFDGTLAMTFEPSPANIGVTEAYDMAVSLVFGEQRFERYQDGGGLRNRSPLEVVQQLIPDTSEAAQLDAFHQLTSAKLAVLLRQIGSRFPNGDTWPNYSKGYPRFRRNLMRLRDQGQVIDEAIVSSGHGAFIRKTFELWNMECPEIIVSSDLIDATSPQVPKTSLVKPSAALMDVTRSLWRAQYGADETDAEQQRIVYVGDDTIIDRKFAENSGVDFVWLNKRVSFLGWEEVSHWLRTKSHIGKTAVQAHAV